MDPETKLDEVLRQAGHKWRAALPAPNADLAQVRDAAAHRSEGPRWRLVIAAAAAVVVLSVTLFTRIGQAPDSFIATPTSPTPSSPSPSTRVATNPTPSLATPTSPAAGPVASSTAGPTSPSAPSTLAGTTVGGPPPAACTGKSFTAAQNYAQAGGAAGHTYLELLLRNVSGQPCLLDGFPTLWMTPSNGRAVTLRTVRGLDAATAATSPGLLSPGEFGVVEVMYTPVSDATPSCWTSAPSRRPKLPAVITVALPQGDTSVPISAAIADDPAMAGMLAGCTGMQSRASRPLNQQSLADAARSPDQVVVDFYTAIGRGDVAAAQGELSAENGGQAAIADPAWMRNFTSLTNVKAAILKQVVDPAMFPTMSYLVQVGVSYDAQVREVMAEGSGTHYRFVYLGRNSSFDSWKILQIATGP